MNNLTMFSNQNVPAFITPADVKETNEALLSHVSTSFPVLSIEGKKFTVVQGDEKHVLMNPNDKRSTLQYLRAVIVAAPKYTARSYYKGGYDPKDEEGKTPICFSSTGIVPDPGVSQPQCRICKLCPYAGWGTAVDAQGNHMKGKACREGMRLAIASPDDIEHPMLLRVPPTSLKALGDLGQLLQRRGVPYTAVIVEISFDPEATMQKLIFQPIEFVSAEQFAKIKEMADSEVVKAITGLTDVVMNNLSEVTSEVPKAAQPSAVVQAPKSEAVEKAAATGVFTAETVKEAVSKSKVQTVQEVHAVSSEEIAQKGLDALNDPAFDDE